MRPDPHQSSQQTISFVPPGREDQVQKALNDYAGRKNNNKKNTGYKKGANSKQGRQNKNNVSKSHVTNQARNLRSTGQSVPANVAQVNANSNTGHYSQQVPHSQSTAVGGRYHDTNSQAGSCPSLPNTLIPPPGMSFSMGPYPYMTPNMGFFPGFMGQPPNQVPMQMQMPMAQAQFGLPPIIPNEFQQGMINNMSQANPASNAAMYQTNSANVNTSAPPTAQPSTSTNTQSFSPHTQYASGIDTLSGDISASYDLNVSRMSDSGIRNGPAGTSPTRTTTDAITKVVSPSKLIEEIDPDDVTINIGSQQL